MPRNRRFDEPGRLHHVCNRGVAKRQLFSRSEDAQFFLECLEHTHASGWLEIHAFCLMGTHFHLVVRSLEGKLPAAMQWLQGTYSRFYNRRHRRDGPLTRGRYWSCGVDSNAYFRALVRYVDGNPVVAQAVRCATDYPLSSARHYAKASGPEWLTRELVEKQFAGTDGRFHPGQYGRDHGRSSDRPLRAWVEAVQRREGGDPEEVDRILQGLRSRDRSWLQSKLLKADGDGRPTSVVDRRSIEAAVAELAGVTEKQKHSLTAGLMRSLGGCTGAEIAATLGVGSSVGQRALERHRAELRDASYRELAVTAGERALALLHFA